MNKKVYPILTMIWPYLSTALLFMVGASEDIVFVWFIYNFAMLITTIVGAVILRKSEDFNGKDILKWNRRVKLSHIPYHIIMAFMAAICYVFASIPEWELVIDGPQIVLMISIMDYILMLTTSAYAFGGLKKAKLEGKIGKWENIVYALLSCVFCLDVFASIFAYRKLKKLDK